MDAWMYACMHVGMNLCVHTYTHAFMCMYIMHIKYVGLYFVLCVLG